jgi:hypothetical protein
VSEERIEKSISKVDAAAVKVRVELALPALALKSEVGTDRGPLAMGLAVYL